MNSFDLVGAEPARSIVIRVRNAQALAAKQGGVSGAIAATLVPDTIESVVMDKMVEKLRSGFKEQGVDADVQIVATGSLGSLSKAPAKSGFGEGLVLGGGLVGAGFAAWRFIPWSVFPRLFSRYFGGSR